MVVYIYTDGNVKIVSPENIYQGSTVTEITLLTPFPSTTSMSVGFVMPDGTTLTAQPMSYTQTIVDGQSVTAYTYTLPYTVTEQAGEVQMAFAALFTNGTQTSYLAKFEVQESVLPTPPAQPDEDTYQLILQYVQEAMSNANNAQNAAEAAQTAAESAETKASQAVNTANEANETAGEANEAAKQANTKSDSAVTTANNAAATASAANQTAIEAKSRASAAQTAAAQAQEDADAAAKSAEAAENSASEAADSAEEAVTTAQGAVSTANEAKTTADGIDGKATQALTNSEQAVTTANEAKELAEQAVAGAGTEVYVDNALQSRLDFTADPQTQINDKQTQINDKQTQIDNIENGTTQVGSAAQADKLSTARNLKVDLSSGNAQPFDGSANAEDIGVDGILPVANGGTGASDLDSIKVGEAGSADEATKLATAINMQVNLASGNTQSFDGSADATEIGVKGILPEGNGGTGATSLDNIVARKDKQVGGIEATSEAANRYLYNKAVVTAQEEATSTITQAGWYRIAEIPPYFNGTLTVVKNYNYGLGIACSINLQVGAVGSTKPQITVVSSNQSANDNNISQVRYTNSSNNLIAYLDVYINYTGKNNWWVFADGVAGYQNIIGLFKVHSFTPVDAGNGNYLLNIGVEAGIYSLGKYNSNGYPVLHGNPPQWVTGTSGSLTLPSSGWYFIQACNGRSFTANVRCSAVCYISVSEIIDLPLGDTSNMSAPSALRIANGYIAEWLAGTVSHSSYVRYYKLA